LEPEHLETISELGEDFGDYMNWISRWPLYIDLGDYLVVHAGIRPGRPLEEQSIEDLTQLRTLDGPNPASRSGTPWFERYTGGKIVIFGHWVFEIPLLRVNAIGIDTGCVYGGSLTAVILPEARLVSIAAQRAYAKRGG
jgi:diadenosine tetraphosphatase ApaH/serine/threonine PP2A family protein phosphatase